MSTQRTIVAAIVLLGLLGASQPSSRAAENVSVRFGLEHAGASSPNADRGRETIVPRVVTVPRGGSVTYQIEPFHNPAIYQPGTNPDDTRVTGSTLQELSLPCMPSGRVHSVIDDANGRVAIGPGPSCDTRTWTTPTGTFDRPGRYLVICTSAQHFRVGMWGWVIVK